MESFKSFGNVLQFLIGDWRHREKIQNFRCRENTAQKSKSQQSGHLNRPLFHHSALSPVCPVVCRLTGSSSVCLQAPRLSAYRSLSVVCRLTIRLHFSNLANLLILVNTQFWPTGKHTDVWPKRICRRLLNLANLSLMFSCFRLNVHFRPNAHFRSIRLATRPNGPSANWVR